MDPAKNPFVLPATARAAQRGAPGAPAIPTVDADDGLTPLQRTRRAIAAIAPAADASELRAATETAALMGAAAGALTRERRRDPESVAGFIAKKREMLLLSLTVDRKRAEVSKLRAAVEARDAALAAAERALDDDAARFDASLKASDAAAHEAAQRADAAARVKADKLHELKRLRHAAAASAGDSAKLRELVGDYRRFAAFLEGLTPPEWVAERAAERAAAVEARRRAAFDDRLAAWMAVRDAAEAAIRGKVEAQRAACLKAGRRPSPVDVAAAVAAAVPPAPTLDAEPAPPPDPDDGGDDGGQRQPPMYFTDPEQLLGLLAGVEDGSLALIQHCQDTEAAVEEARAALADATAQSAAVEAALRALGPKSQAEDAGTTAGNVTSLAADVSDSNGRDGSTSSGGDEAALLTQLRARVAAMCERCGVTASPASSDCVDLLAALEGRLEALLAETDRLDPAYVAAAEKGRERARRDRLREARLRAQAESQGQRQSTTTQARPQAPAARRASKPAMTRSVPPGHPPRAEAPNQDLSADLARQLQDAKYLT